MKQVTTAAAAVAAQSTAQRRLYEIQVMQEIVVNAGHRPDMAVSAILALERQRQRIIDADKVLARVMLKAEDEAHRIMDGLTN